MSIAISFPIGNCIGLMPHFMSRVYDKIRLMRPSWDTRNPSRIHDPNPRSSALYL